MLGGSRLAGYQPTRDAISQLAAVGADTRWLMTTGFVTFGTAVPAFAMALHRVLPGRAWMAAVATGVATLGVAATPLDSSATIDRLHGVFAGIGYVTLAATPFLASGPLRRAGYVKSAAASAVVAALVLACLGFTVNRAHDGLFQRLGLTLGDAWLVTAAVAMALRNDKSGVD